MKIPITKYGKEKLVMCILISIIFTVFFLLSYFYFNEEAAEQGFWRFCLDNWVFLLVAGVISGSLWYLVVSDLEEYDVQLKGLYVMPRFGKSYFTPWTEFVYVGPIGFSAGLGGPRKIFICAKSLPYRDKHGYVALPKERIQIDYTPEAKVALERYCPIYSTKFESWTFGNVFVK